jgi:hypothetical protein
MDPDDCELARWVYDLLESQENPPTLTDTTDYTEDDTWAPTTTN